MYHNTERRRKLAGSSNSLQDMDADMRQLARICKLYVNIRMNA